MTDPNQELLERLAQLESRLDHVESVQAIEALAHRYALYADSRDLEALLLLFVDDVYCGKLGVGRDALRQSYEVIHRNFYRTVHQVVGHTIDFQDADHAEGLVMMRAEHEVGDRWVVAVMTLFDRYERRDGRWYFVRRKPQNWYSSDYGTPPEGPGFSARGWGTGSAPLPHAFPTWETFWSGHDDRIAELTEHP